MLKVSPARRRVSEEAAALERWKTVHVPAVLAVDESLGALLIEAAAPGASLAESVAAYPRLESLGALMTALHVDDGPDSSYPAVAERIADLYESGRKNYERRPQLAALIPPELYERGRQLAMRLAADASATVLVHGDLTPANVLDGGEERGLVAIDPAPCLGDPAFDAIDLLPWRAEDLETITARAQQLALVIGVEAGRLFRWCAAFAAMTALEIAGTADTADRRAELLVALARAET